MRVSQRHNTRQLRTNANRGGFTLIEIVFVLAIIALLVGAGIYSLRGVIGNGQRQRVKADFEALRVALNLYRQDSGNYPSTEQGLEALVTKPKTGRVLKNYTPYMKKVQRDPWDNPYIYAWPPPKGGIDPVIYSLGRDRMDGTGDEIYMDADEFEEE